MKHSVVAVGVDGSPASGSALRWAAVAAALRHDEMVVVHAYGGPATSPRAQAIPDYADEVREHAYSVIEAAVAEAQAMVSEHPRAGDIKIRGEVFAGHPSSALLHWTERAALTVVGCRGSGGFATLLLGSVAEQVATYACGPVAVVRGRPGRETRPVVVAIDGQADGDRVDVAFAEAVARGTSVLAVRVFQVPEPPLFPSLAATAPAIDPAPYRVAAEQALSEAIAGWQVRYPAVPVTGQVREGHPSEVLIGLSSNAELLVVGRGDHGRRAESGPGPVTEQLLHYAGCPVVVVPELSPAG